MPAPLPPHRRTRVDARVRELHAALPHHEDGRLVLPIDVEALATGHVGLRVVRVRGLAGTRTENRSGRPLSGLLDFGRSRIYIEQRDAPRRQRFTIAHELAHYVLGHAPAYAGALHAVLLGDGSGGRPGAAADPAASDDQLCAELEADRLAGRLLVPPGELDRAVRERGPSVPLLADLFEVSAPAMRLHLAPYFHPTPAWEDSP